MLPLQVGDQDRQQGGQVSRHLGGVVIIGSSTAYAAEINP